jgi:competence ComEA-like helix-hairpin-helix protein
LFISFFKLTKLEIKSIVLFSALLAILIVFKIVYFSVDLKPEAQLQVNTYSKKPWDKQHSKKYSKGKKSYQTYQKNNGADTKILRNLAQKTNINSVSLNDLEAQNFDTKKAQRIINFRDKIGGFTNWTQVEKIFEIKDDELDWFKNNTFIEIKTIDINTATEEEWIELKGIGETLAKRIVKYRDKIGGFYSIQQLKEVYGIKPEVLESITPQLKIHPKNIQKISIAISDYQSLAKHPYLNNYFAKLIINKRSTGEIQSVNDLQYVLPDSVYQKIINYVEW